MDTPATVATTVDSVDTEDWAMVDTTLLDTTVDTQVIDRSLSHALISLHPTSQKPY